jgi:hyperosmotically inducible protein
MNILKIKLVAVACLASVSLALAQQPARDHDTIDEIRTAILRLPYYGVFDFLAVQYDKGTATLSGYVYQPSLAREVIAATRRVPRVDDVVDKIERLPLSQHDDDIRWRTFTRIYDDSALSRYAAGGGLTRFDRRYNVARYPGMQPFGYYPIHIIVNRGRTLLLGVVDSEFDKTLAGIRAREVPGTFGVDNELVIAGSTGR